jgi:hypothetical protein
MGIVGALVDHSSHEEKGSNFVTLSHYVFYNMRAYTYPRYPFYRIDVKGWG